jgi:hypothetical protein
MTLKEQVLKLLELKSMSDLNNYYYSITDVPLENITNIWTDIHDEKKMELISNDFRYISYIFNYLHVHNTLKDTTLFDYSLNYPILVFYNASVKPRHLQCRWM